MWYLYTYIGSGMRTIYPCIKGLVKNFLKATQIDKYLMKAQYLKHCDNNKDDDTSLRVNDEKSKLVLQMFNTHCLSVLNMCEGPLRQVEILNKNNLHTKISSHPFQKEGQ